MLAELTFLKNRTGYFEKPAAELSKLRAWLELGSVPGKTSVLLPISARASPHLQGKNSVRRIPLPHNNSQSNAFVTSTENSNY